MEWLQAGPWYEIAMVATEVLKEVQQQRKELSGLLRTIKRSKSFVYLFPSVNEIWSKFTLLQAWCFFSKYSRYKENGLLKECDSKRRTLKV